MDRLENWIAPISFGFFILGALLLVWRHRRQPGRESRDRGARRALSTELQCTNCQRMLVLTLEDTRPLIPAEKALLVREHPEIRGQQVVEAVCPFCESRHAFLLESETLHWLCVNANTPESHASRCAECRKVLRPAPWTPGSYDGKLREAPELAGDFALICDRCGALCCLDCAEKRPGAFGEEDFQCPRCFRKGLHRFYHGHSA